MRRVRNIVIFWIILFQLLRIGLGIDKNETTFLALDDFKPPRNSKNTVPSLKKELMLMGPTNFAGNLSHCLSRLLSHNDRGISPEDDLIPHGLIQPVDFLSFLRCYTQRH
jgi:hypothetical protein